MIIKNYTKIIKKYITIFLNNYCELKNDSISYTAYSKAKERKHNFRENFKQIKRSKSLKFFINFDVILSSLEQKFWLN